MAKKFMKLTCIMLIISFLAPAALAQSPGPPPEPQAELAPHAPGEVLVKFQPWVNSAQAQQHLAALNLKIKRQIPALEVKLVKLPPGLSVEEALSRLSHRQGIQYVEPNYIYQITADPPQEVPDQWSLTRIQAPKAWETFTPEQKVPILLATVDTGVDRNHTDLAANIWNNQDELPGNGLDDDGNGYIDDTWGWDFVNNDNDPFDDNLHGTAVSSVMAGVQDGTGVVGVCPWCQVMAVKVLSAAGSGTLDVVANGITYAADNNARAINLSLAGGTGAQTLQDAVDYAWSKGAMVAAGAGNNGANAPMYPAGYANAMAVASTGPLDTHSCFSNYAEDYISVAAPGENMLIALPNQEFGYGSGTSLSTPLVSGLAGLLLSKNQSRTNAQLRSIIESTAIDLSPAGFDAAFGHGRIDALRAVTGDSTQVQPPDGMFSTNGTASGYAHARKLVRDPSNVLHVIWHTQEGGLYRIRYATSSNNGTTWDLQPDVYSSTLETYHSALASDGSNLFVAIPRRSAEGSPYEIYYTWKPIGSGAWSDAVALMGGTYDAVRPDLYFDQVSNKLHLVASSLDNAPLVYYRSTSNPTATAMDWSPVVNVNPSQGTQSAGANTRYATIHANGDNLYIVARTMTGYLITYYYTHSVRSTDGGQTWFDQTHIASFLAIVSGEYGLSVAGVGDRLYMGYEVGANLYFRSFENGAWSNYLLLESGDASNINKWPTITQAPDGKAWLLWEVNGQLFMRHYDGGTWLEKEPAGTASYANLKLGTSGERVEWISTQCNGAPFLLAYDSIQLDGGTNGPPQADDQSLVLDEDTSIPVTLTGSDPDGDTLTFSVTVGPANGTLTGVEPNLTYQPDADYYGPDSFSFIASDGSLNSNPATVSITVNPVNDPPTADNASLSTLEDTPLAITLSGDDIDGDLISFRIETHPTHGSLSGSAPNILYTPDADYVGSDSFTFVTSDGTLDSQDATVSIQVTPTNDPPSADDQSLSTPEDTALPVTLTASDPEDDSLNFNVTLSPAHGTLSGTAPDLTYLPDPDYNGPDSFTFVANDGSSDSNPATINITVNPVNDPPTANADSITTDEDMAVGITLTASDVDGTIDTYTVAVGPFNGTLTGTAPDLVYTPGADFFGADSFTFTASDGSLASEPATISIQVNAVNDPPTAENQAVSLDEDTSLPITLTGSDPDDITLTFSILQPPSNGSLLGTPPNLTYQPAADYFGPDSFTFIASDGELDSSPGMVTISVDPVNDPPQAYPVSAATQQDTTGTWYPEVADLDDLALSCSIFADPGMEATATVVTDCTSGTYTPPAGISGTDSFSYQVCDPGGACDDAVVSYTITNSSAHVGDIDSFSTPAPRARWNATVEITVHDSQENPLANALVEGSWSEGVSGGSSCTTDASGVCSLTKTNIKSNVTGPVFTITNVTHATLNYAPQDNHDPDGDSDGTSIVVYQDGPTPNQPPLASFSYDCTDLACTFSGAGSSDPDGSISAYAWDFGDGHTAVGESSQHTFVTGGTYPVTLTVTDNDDATGMETQQVFVGSGSLQYLHVGDLSGYGEIARKDRWNALVTIWVHTTDHTTFEGATVTGSWNTGREMSCTTTSGGYCTVILSNLKTALESVVFTVTNLAAPGTEYQASENHETVITISLPQ